MIRWCMIKKQLELWSLTYFNILCLGVQGREIYHLCFVFLITPNKLKSAIINYSKYIGDYIMWFQITVHVNAYEVSQCVNKYS